MGRSAEPRRSKRGWALFKALKGETILDDSRRDELLEIYIEASATLHEGALACHEAGLPPVLGQFSAAFYIARDAAGELLASHGIDVSEQDRVQ